MLGGIKLMHVSKRAPDVKQAMILEITFQQTTIFVTWITQKKSNYHEENIIIMKYVNQKIIVLLRQTHSVMVIKFSNAFYHVMLNSWEEM